MECIEGWMKRTRVMIVDDVADIRLMLRYLIEREEYVIVAEAANGVEAVEKYHEHRPDITIMDIDMPFKTGFEAAREIRKVTDSARIIFCSGGISTHESAPAEIGKDSLLRKPFLPAQLYQAMAL
jgi:two-component system chemotaxis response regulator CheY